MLIVRWGEGPDKACRVDYQLPEQDPDDPSYQQVEVRCVALGGRTEIAFAE
ncbi:hypothetical protein PSm6_25290 [Pseudomonas solani]|uniref:PapC-like C-terminal domain-containing protein n=1 Tax=Pseudomonas solani TaxID=2731552 RepID=A0ABM7L986_9PSED|nr:hypothetical protein [Pseudomonas solani]BCD86122.1 hypothetical protein PSm6_25290 [Pseudomonas solani]